MPTFSRKSELFELFDDLFQTNLKIHNQLTEENKINCFHSLLRGDALQKNKNIGSENREDLGEILTVFRRKNLKPQSMITGKHNFQRLVFKSSNHKLIDIFDKLQKLAKFAFGVAAPPINEQFLNAKMPPHLKISKNQAFLENGRHEQIVPHLERELELQSFKAPGELQMNTMIQMTKLMTTLLEVLTVTQTTLSPKVTKMTKGLKLSVYPVERVETQTIQQRNVTMEPIQHTGHFPGRANWQYRTDLSYRKNRTI